MTVYNAGRFLAGAVGSILDQTFPDYEFVIVDDCSTDGSLEKLREYAVRDRRVRVIANSANKGQTACLNQGLAVARGDWIARQDADDWSAPERLALQVEAVRKNPGLVLVGTNGWIVDASGGVTGTINVPLADAGIRWSMGIRNPFVHTSVMFRRVLPDGQPARYDESYQVCQDWELWARLADTGKMANLAGRLVSYRDHGASLSKSRLETTLREAALVAGGVLRGEELSGEELSLLAAFRDGLPLDKRRDFWQLYHRLLRRRAPGEGLRQARAVHHLQAAGALAGQCKRAAAAEILRAAALAPTFAAIFIRERILFTAKQSAGEAPPQTKQDRL